MGLKKTFLAGFGCCALLVACAATFPYHAYEYDIDHGTLRGAEPKDDLPASICEPVSGSKYPCMVIKTAEYFKMKADYLKTKQALIDCQAGNAPNP